MKTVSKEEEKLIELSEQKNPYAKECPNRHLWSEGFRSGYHTASERTAKLEELVKAYEELAEKLHDPDYEILGVTVNGDSNETGDRLSRVIKQLRKRITELNNNLK